MSHDNVVYPLSTNGLTLAHNSCAVREESDDYRPFSSVLLEYTDLVDRKLPQLRVVGALMQSARTISEDSIEDAGTLIADLVDDVMLAHRAMQAEYERQKK